MRTSRKRSGQTTRKRITILLVDDHPCVLEGVRTWLSKRRHIHVVGIAQNAKEAILRTKKLLPKIVIMDLSLPGYSGLSIMKRLRKEYPSVKVIVYSMHDESEFVQASVDGGAKGYVLKGSDLCVLVTAIDSVHSGGAYFDPALSLGNRGSIWSVAHRGKECVLQPESNELEYSITVSKTNRTNRKSCLEAVNAFVNENLSPSLSVKEIAVAVGRHPTDLGRMFWRETGFTVKQYIDRMCRQKVEKMMQDGDCKGSHLALKLGFRSDQAFYRWIQRVFGKNFKDLQRTYVTVAEINGSRRSKQK